MFETVVGMIALFAIAFLLGSIPWGVIISRVFYHTDIRQHGSGNIGTTNAMRAMGKVGGIAVFVLDFGKGLVSGLIARAVCESFFTPLASFDIGQFYHASIALAFLGCILGHIFSPWLHFRGGKGIAVAVGCLFVTFGPVGALIEIMVFALVVIATRYVSAGSLAAALLCPFLALYYFWGYPFGWACCLVAALVVIWAHRSNISRLRNGCENRIGGSKTKTSQNEA
ncbi:glycerol-3-phosphate 1-O-acyltransferase PlsY [Adlercreutzia agrestimuris]|uniref:glycerol-3-phosphate 1-O-acyltransferase PlsY n=1 Tax=Adlercreutzia agrestimuris TaxID=2941324 RepID=UPI00203C6811|nr:glycerol-3-phosphate 1-O-acyltransferase PlsY [Adlercreutzia agrestimuris]